MATTKTKTTTNKKGPTKAELEAQIIELQALLAKATQQSVAEPTTVSAVPNITIATPNTDVVIVYCSDSLGYIQLSNLSLNFSRYGEKFTLTRYQFDELVGKYRSWFDRGILAVDSRYVNVAIDKGVRTELEYHLKSADLESLGTMSVEDLESLWYSNPVYEHRLSIVTYYKRKFVENAPGFRDRAKVDLLNRLTDKGFTREQDELNGRYTIAQTDM